MVNIPSQQGHRQPLKEVKQDSWLLSRGGHGPQNFGYQKAQLLQECLQRESEGVVRKEKFKCRRGQRTNGMDIISKLPFSVITAPTDSSKSPEFPMHVVHPYPTILKPCSFKYFCSPLQNAKKKKQT
jgi:hypothetical protein